MKLCECGCGGAAPISHRTDAARGYVAGQPRRFIRGHNTLRVERTAAPYRQVHVRSHPRSPSLGEHILVAERALGKFLPAGAQVHHVDGDKQHNANSNLVVCQDAVYHALLHFRANVLARGGNPNVEKWCPKCGAMKPFADFAVRTFNKIHGRSSYCRDCVRALKAAS